MSVQKGYQKPDGHVNARLCIGVELYTRILIATGVKRGTSSTQHDGTTQSVVVSAMR